MGTLNTTQYSILTTRYNVARRFFSSPTRKDQVSTRAYYNPVKPSCYTVEPEIFVITVTTVLSVRFYVRRG